jgi:hypothetical protein
MDKEGRKQMIDEDGYILKEVWSAKRIKIPDGYVKCSECQGTGKVKIKQKKDTKK